MPAGQPSAADTEIRLSLLLCPARPVPVSGSQGGDGETVLQPVRSALGRSRKHAHLSLGRSTLPVALFRRFAGSRTPPKDRPGLSESPRGQVLAADERVPDGGSV